MEEFPFEDSTPPARPVRPREPRRGISWFAFLAATVVSGLLGVAAGTQVDVGGSSAVPAQSVARRSPSAPAGSSGAANAAGLDANQIAAVAAKVEPGVVDITTVLGYQSGQAAGTGMILTASGEVLTNNHVVNGATSISVTAVSTGRTYVATVVGTDPTEDIAVLQLQGASGLTPIKKATAPIAVGQQLVALGNAGGVGGRPSVVSGSVVAVDQTITASDTDGSNPETLHGLVQTDAPIEPGDSGGPLANTAGAVVGMNTAARSASGRGYFAGGNEGYAITISHALTIAAEIESGHASSTVHIGVRGVIGVGLSTRTASAVVVSVAADSPGDRVGIAVGATITGFDGQTVDSAAQLATIAQNHHAGDTVALTWIDASGRTHDATITLAPGPAD